MARGFSCGQHLYLHDGAHGGRRELFRGDVEITADDDWLHHTGDKGEQASPQLSICMPLDALTCAEIGHDHEDFSFSKGPLHCIPTTAVNDLLVDIVEVHVGRIDQQMTSMRASFTAFCCWMTQHPKPTGSEPLLNLLVVLKSKVGFDHEDWGSWPSEQPLSNWLSKIGDISKCKADSVEASPFCWLFNFFNLCSTWEFTSDFRW